MLSGERTMVEICREHELTAQMVSDWKAQFLAGAAQVFDKGKPEHEEQGADRRAGADGRETDDAAGDRK